VAIEVPSDSLASEAGIREGDVIQAVNRKKIREIADLEKFKKEIDPAKGLVFDVVRQGKSFYLSFKSVP
jgi:S1-C subfamily serine protease